MRLLALGLILTASSVAVAQPVGSEPSISVDAILRGDLVRLGLVPSPEANGVLEATVLAYGESSVVLGVPEFDKRTAATVLSMTAPFAVVSWAVFGWALTVDTGDDAGAGLVRDFLLIGSGSLGVVSTSVAAYAGYRLYVLSRSP